MFKTRLKQYYKNFEESFRLEKNTSQILKNTSDKGILRELAYLDFLKRHIPKNTEALLGGFVFDQKGKESSQFDVKQSITGNLVGGAIGGFDMVLSEILGSNEHIKEIDHSENKIIFSYGAATACILITNGTSKEFKYRLEMFHLTFEKRFNKEILKNWDGSVNQLTKIDDLIQQFFT